MLAMVVMTWWFGYCLVDFAGFGWQSALLVLVMHTTMVFVSMVGFATEFGSTMSL